MNLDFNQARWQAVQETHRRWWQGTLGRPLIHLWVNGRDAGRPEPKPPAYEFTSFYDPSVSAEAIADRWRYDLECRRFLGDAFPHVRPNFGPSVPSLFLGLELHNGNGTVWAHQPNQVELKNVEFNFDFSNVWFRRVCDIYRAAGARFEGLVQLGMTDLGGNLDLLASFRQSDNLAMDFYDVPETVELKSWEAHQAWWRCFQELDALIQPAHPGYTAWTPFYSETPYFILQCDYSYMIGPDTFKRFVMPELVATCRRLGNPFYHLDGPGALPHLDLLLSIPELKGIQWIPGAGQPPITQWPEVLKRIRAAGKTVQFFTDQDPLGWRALEVIANQLGSLEGIAMFGEVPAEEETQVRQRLKRYGAE
jgi:hypothetical protein